MIQAHQQLGGSSVANGGVRAPCPVEKPSKSLELQQRENYNDALLGRYLPARRVNPDPIGLFVIGWYELTVISTDSFFSHTSRTRQTFAMRAQFDQLLSA